MLRTLIFVVVLVLATIIGAIPVLLVGLFNPYTRFSRAIARAWSRLLLWTGNIEVEIEGMEHVQPYSSYVVVSNHQSHMDIPVIFAHLPLMLTVVAKKELFRIPLFGQAMHAFGILKIDRQDRESAVETMRQAEQVIRQHRLSLLAFPEGTRSLDGKIHPFKKGPFVVAIHTELPILPVSLSGTFRILPKKSLTLRSGRVKMHILPPVSTAGFTYENRNELAQLVRKKIQEAFDENYS